MRKLVAIVSISALVLGLATAPALAGKKKKTVTEDWSVMAVPGPFDPGTAFPEGCLGMSVEGVHRVSHAFTTPGTGVLDASMTNFVGDWDLYVADADGNELGRSAGFVDVTTERVIVSAKKGQELSIVACNLYGGPTADLSLTYTYK